VIIPFTVLAVQYPAGYHFSGHRSIPDTADTAWMAGKPTKNPITNAAGSKYGGQRKAVPLKRKRWGGRIPKKKPPKKKKSDRNALRKYLLPPTLSGRRGRAEGEEAGREIRWRWRCRYRNAGQLLWPAPEWWRRLFSR